MVFKKKCSYCGNIFETWKTNKKYCSKDCAKKANQDKSNYKKENQTQVLGTISFPKVFDGDFEKEAKRIKYLKKMAGIK